MSILARRIYLRWLRCAAIVAILLEWFPVADDLSRLVSDGTSALTGTRLLLALARALRSLWVAVAVGAPLAMIMTIGAVRRRNVLATYLAAGGRAVSSLRAAFAAAALTALIASAACFEGYSRAETAMENVQAAGHGTLWTAGDVYLWEPWPGADPAGSGTLVAFGRRTLDVSLVGRGSDGGWEARGPGPLAGERVSPPAVEPELLAGVGSYPPPPARWLSASVPFGHALAGVTWVVPAALLLLTAGYTALLMPTSRYWLTYPAFIAVLPVVGMAMFVNAAWLWQGRAAGIVGASVWLTALSGGVLGLDRAFALRGLRICGADGR